MNMKSKAVGCGLWAEGQKARLASGDSRLALNCVLVLLRPTAYSLQPTA
jgi:hypothetical protein